MAKGESITESDGASRSLEQEAYLSLQRTADLLARGAEEAIKPSGLSGTQYNVLRILRGAGPSGLCCGEVAERMLTRDPDITRLLDRLEKRGLIVRARESKDRRLITVRIAPEGLRILAELDGPIAEFHRRQLGHLGERRLRLLMGLLNTTRVTSAFVLVLFFGISSIWAGEQPVKVQVHWDQVIRVSQTTPTLLLGASPVLMRGAPLHDQMFQRVKDLGADEVRYAGAGYVYPHLGVAELEPPTATTTSWDFSFIDPVTEDVMKALEGHPVVLNFTTIPAWMFKTAEPVRYPADPRKEAWHYGQGTELRDPTFREVADYFARLVAWHVKGGFTDELGKWHPSGHHYKVDYWEVFNEPDLEHGFSAETYTKLYDAVVQAIHKVSPQTKFVGISHSYIVGHPEYLTYFLNPKHHQPGIPLDMISYHFYAVPNADEPPEAQQFTYFNQADKFLEIVGYIETIRKMLSPKTGTMVNEIGTMLPDDWSQTSPDYVFKPIRPSYWSLSAATFAYVFAGLARLGIDAAGESAIPCGPGMWPSISMLDWDTAQPNPRYWVLKLILDNFRPGDRIVEASSDSGYVMTQAFVSPSGERKLLLVNKRDREFEISLPEAGGGKIEMIDLTTGSNPPASSSIAGSTFKLGGFGVAAVTLAK